MQGRLIICSPSGHDVLATWEVGKVDRESAKWQQAVGTFKAHRVGGMVAVKVKPGPEEIVLTLEPEAEEVALLYPLAGGS